MNRSISYSEARANFAKICDEVVENNEVLVLNRRGKEDLALIGPEELSSVMETLHLLSSPTNANRLLNSIDIAKNNPEDGMSLEELKSNVGLYPAEMSIH